MSASLRTMQRLAKLAINGDFDQLYLMVNADSSIPGLLKSRDDSGRTVLMLAADTLGSTRMTVGKCIEYFLHLEADVSAADSAGNTAAHMAARRNNLRMLALLPFEAKWLANGDGCSPLMEAVRAGSWQCAKHLLHLFRQRRYHDRRADLLGMRDRHGRTALQIANDSGQTDLAAVIEFEQRITFLGGHIRSLSLSEAIIHNDLDQFTMSGDLSSLRAKATRVNCDLPDWWGRTALMRAVEYRRCDVVQSLLTLGADATATDTRGVSCLILAAGYGCVGAVGPLVAAGAPVNALDFIREITPIVATVEETPYSLAAATFRALIVAGANWNAISKWRHDHPRFGDTRELMQLLRRFKNKIFFAPQDRHSCCRYSLQCLAAEVMASHQLPTDQLPRRISDFVSNHAMFQPGCGDIAEKSIW